jgi:hypothetical protein
MRGTYVDVEGALRDREQKKKKSAYMRQMWMDGHGQKRGELTDGVARILAFLSWRSLSSRTDNSSMGGTLGFGGTLKPGRGAIFLDRIGEGGLLRGHAACMCVEM